MQARQKNEYLGIITLSSPVMSSERLLKFLLCTISLASLLSSCTYFYGALQVIRHDTEKSRVESWGKAYSE